jgi:hypothetical protein
MTVFLLISLLFFQSYTLCSFESAEVLSRLAAILIKHYGSLFNLWDMESLVDAGVLV